LPRRADLNPRKNPTTNYNRHCPPIIVGYGHIGFVAIMIVLFAIGFMWERISPTEQDH
jgi:hypothetical protein